MHDHRDCPFWVGYLLINPLRRFVHNPTKIVGPYVRAGMTVLDVGSAMGHFSLPMARMAAPGGRVICVDMQERMLKVLERRARKAGVADWIEARPCAAEPLGLGDLDGKVDFALAFAMVHETPDAGKLFAEIHKSLKPGSVLLVAEPKGHVPEKAFEATLAAARAAGFEEAGTPRIARCHAVLLRKRQSGAGAQTS